MSPIAIDPAIIQQAQEAARAGGLQTTDPEMDRAYWRKDNHGPLASENPEAKKMLEPKHEKFLDIGNNGFVHLRKGGGPGTDDYKSDYYIVIDNPDASIKIASGPDLISGKDSQTITVSDGKKNYTVTEKEPYSVREYHFFLPNGGIPVDLTDMTLNGPSIVNIYEGRPAISISNSTRATIFLNELKTTEPVVISATPEAIRHLAVTTYEDGVSALIKTRAGVDSLSVAHYKSATPVTVEATGVPENAYIQTRSLPIFDKKGKLVTDTLALRTMGEYAEDYIAAEKELNGHKKLTENNIPNIANNALSQ